MKRPRMKRPPMSYYEHLKVGDTVVGFLSWEQAGENGREIDGRNWFDRGHNPIARTFAEAAREIFRLSSRYLEEFPGLYMRLDRKAGMGGLFLPLKNGREIVLGFTTNILTKEQHATLQPLIRKHRRLKWLMENDK